MKLVWIVLLGLAGLSASAEAGRLTTAKTQGLVCELRVGLLGPVGTPKSDIIALIEEKNAKRLAKYTAIAQSGGTTAAEVGKVAADVIRSQGLPGMFFEDVTGVCIPLK